VLNTSYASQIARDWNTRGGGIGYVLRFKSGERLPHQIPSADRRFASSSRLLGPAEELETFNQHIVGSIEVIAEYRPIERQLAASALRRR
jgi:hypothetical protein